MTAPNRGFPAPPVILFTGALFVEKIYALGALNIRFFLVDNLVANPADMKCKRQIIRIAVELHMFFKIISHVEYIPTFVTCKVW